MKPILFTLSLLLSLSLQAQEKLTFQPAPHIQGSVLFGGLLTFNNIAFAPGMSISGSMSLWQSDKVQLGVGLGHESYRQIRSWPVWGEVRRVLGKKKKAYFIGQAGYAFAYSQGFGVTSAFKMRGGLLGSVGIGKILPLTDRLNLELDISYKAQRNTLTYPSDGVRAAVIEPSQYHFLVLSVGVGRRNEN